MSAAGGLSRSAVVSARSARRQLWEFLSVDEAEMSPPGQNGSHVVECFLRGCGERERSRRRGAHSNETVA